MQALLKKLKKLIKKRWALSKTKTLKFLLTLKLKKKIKRLENLTKEVSILTDKVNADAKTIDRLKKDLKAKNLEIEEFKVLF